MLSSQILTNVLTVCYATSTRTVRTQQVPSIVHARKVIPGMEKHAKVKRKTFIKTERALSIHPSTNVDRQPSALCPVSYSHIS